MPYKTPKGMTPKAASRARATSRAQARTRQQLRTPGRATDAGAGSIATSAVRLAAAVGKSLSRGSKVAPKAPATGKTRTVRTAPNSMTVASPGKGGAASVTKGRGIATAVNKGSSGRVTYTSPPRSPRQVEAAAKSSARMKKVQSKARNFNKAVGYTAVGAGTAGYISGAAVERKKNTDDAIARKREEQRARNKAKSQRRK